MLNTIDFSACIRENLKDRRFGKERADKILEDFEARAAYHASTGASPTVANLNAMRDVFENMTVKTTEAAKRNAAMLATLAANNARVEQGLRVTTSNFLMDGKRGSQGVALARAAVSTIEDDPRFAGLSYSTNRQTARQQLFAIFGDVLDKVGKGAFGIQRGKAHLDNIIREIKGETTGDATAKEFADAWLKVSDLMVDLFNEAGGSMTKLARYVPQSMNAVKMTLAKEGKWVADHMRALDWNRTRWPDGSIIPPDQRERVLQQVYRTMTSDGANKIDPTAFRGQGRAIGNQLDNHRFLHYDGAQNWLDMHNAYGDGNVFDVFVRHMDTMAHRIALVQTYGPNPEMANKNLHALVRKYASELSPRDQADADAVMKNKFDPMFATVMRENPMDPHSTMGALVTGAGNILTSAQLGAASLLAIPGDFVQAAAVRALNGMGLFGGTHFYLKALATDRPFMDKIATQSGFIHDEAVMSTYASTRFTGVATVGPAVSRRISDTVMRLSLMSGHTRAARWATQAEFMGLLDRSRDTKFEELPFMRVMQRYGITPEDWKAFSKVPAWEPRAGVKFLRPIDILQSGISDAQTLYRKFQGMVFEESRKMVPEATIEGATMLKDTTRPDTLVGSLLYSFAMYKNFPVSFNMIYGRLGMTSPSVKGRLGFYAGLGASMTLVGAMGIQMRELSKGREPLPMDTPAFLGKALLAGGGLSVYGDFLFQGINEFGRGPQDMVAGPVVSFAGDTAQLVLGDTFNFVNAVGGLNEKGSKTPFAAKAVEYARRYTPGSSIWWARLALEREVFDRLQELADPKAYSKRQKRAAKQKQNYGNDYWFAPNKKFIGG
jgi:hypothetical protein